MEYSYKIWHPPQRYDDFWKKENYESLYGEIVVAWGKISAQFSKNEMEIKILNRKDKGKKMPRKIRDYLLSKDLEITDVIMVKNPGIRKLSRIEKKAIKKGKIFLPVGTEGNMCKIWMIDDPYKG